MLLASMKECCTVFLRFIENIYILNAVLKAFVDQQQHILDEILNICKSLLWKKQTNKQNKLLLEMSKYFQIVSKCPQSKLFNNYFKV